MPASQPPAPQPLVRASPLAVTAGYLVIGAEWALALASSLHSDRLPGYVLWHGLYLGLYSVQVWRPATRVELRHLYFAVQAGAVAALLWLNPQLGTVTALFVLLAFQAAVEFDAASRWAWVGVFAVLLAGPLIYAMGALEGLARALLPMTGCFVLAAYVTAKQATERAQLASQGMLAELETLHQQLQAEAVQAEELARLEARNQLASALHASVSQTVFDIGQHSRAAQLTLEHAPAEARQALEQLSQLTRTALAEMRGLIARWRPQAD